MFYIINSDSWYQGPRDFFKSIADVIVTLYFQRHVVHFDNAIQSHLSRLYYLFAKKIKRQHSDYIIKFFNFIAVVVRVYVR